MGTCSDLLNIVRLHWSLFLGNMIEWYDFALYGYLERFLEEKFFQGSAIGTWLGFGVTFFARPAGGAIFGAIADRLGRSTAVNLTIVGMLIGTCGQGMLPTYDMGDAVGHTGVVLLIVLRLLQGMSAGGEICTVSMYIAEAGRRRSVGRAMSLIPITAVTGFLLAKSVCFVTRESLGKDGMMSWGWRVPFLVALVPGAISIWGRKFMPESKAFLEQKAAAAAAAAATEEPSKEGDASAEEAPAIAASRPLSVWESVMSCKINCLIAMGGVAAHGILLYGGFIWTNTFLIKRGLPTSGAMLASLVARSLMILLALPVGWLVDRRGVGWVMLASSSAQAVLGVPLFFLLHRYATSLPVVIAVVGVAYSLLYATGACFFLFVVELFPVAVRGAAMGVSYNIGICIFGGLGPAATELLLHLTPMAPGVLISLGGSVTAAAVVVALVLDSRGAVTIAHVRPYPYFGGRRLVGDAALHGAKGGERSASTDGEDCPTLTGSSQTTDTSMDASLSDANPALEETPMRV